MNVLLDRYLIVMVIVHLKIGEVIHTVMTELMSLVKIKYSLIVKNLIMMKVIVMMVVIVVKI